ncbi:Hypp3809 [Branchiostoma lanceolatum]|uniref:Hypp3809 protein n=1 Tax=Branchiostoma lanceolatum TaxID=7740 RepID=A0A8K0EVG5_BRALA|nr:Hypp3809 [Branchiostoma lanceolatum]
MQRQQKNKQNQAAENGQLDAAKQGEQLPSPTMAQDVGAKAINYNYYTTNIYTGPFFNGGHNDYPSVSNTDSCREKRTMDTKDPLNGLIQFTAYEASTSWRDIARQLGLRANEIEQIEWEYRGKMKECCIKALNLWRERKGKHATVEVLKKALNDAEPANCELQDVATSHSGQVEEETSITETENYNHVESDSSRHYHRETTTDQVNDLDPQAETQPKNATTTSTLPKRPIKEGSSRRCLFSKYTASHQETRGPNDDPRSLPSTCAQPTSVESQPGRKKRQGKSWSFNKRHDKRRFEMSQHPTNRGGRHQSSPGPNSSAGHETGAPDKFRFPWKKTKVRPNPQ